MARRPAQYGTAKVKERDAGRPLLVILILVAAGIAVFLWLQPDDSTTPVVAPPEETAPTEAAETEPEVEGADEPGVEDWWSRVEGSIYDAFRAGEDGDCDALRWAVEDLAARDTRSEPPLAAAYRGLVGTLERAAEVCESRPEALPGTLTSASRRLESLVQAGRPYGVEVSSFLEEHL